MSCCLCVTSFIALILGLAGTVMGIYAVIKLTQDTDPSCDVCKTLAGDAWETICKDLC